VIAPILALVLASLPWAGPVPASALEEGSPTFTMMPPAPYRAKDFAFVYAGGMFHLFYIRENSTIPAESDSNALELGHAVSTDLRTWNQLAPVMHTRTDKWDNLHIWAPSIVDNNGTFYMFYTGVTKVPFSYTWYQRTGVASSTDPNLALWSRDDAPLYSGSQSGWVYSDSSQFSGCQFRDPFVMKDPAHPGQWLHYYCATPLNATATNMLIVGTARSTTPSGPWPAPWPMLNTDGTAAGLGFCESPHVFQFNGLWYLFFTTNGSRPIAFETATSPTADSTGWSSPLRLYAEAGAESTASNQWFASEHLKVGSHHYLAVANALTNGIEIREMFAGTPPHFSLGSPTVTAVEGGEPPDDVRITWLGPATKRGSASLRLDLPQATPARVDIFDVMGRRTLRLLERRLPAGETVVSWDGRDAAGTAVGCGMYFARLATPAGVRVARVPIVR
jgi:hypothetical protein